MYAKCMMDLVEAVSVIIEATAEATEAAVG